MQGRRKSKKMIKTSQDPVVYSSDSHHVTMETDNLECQNIKEEIEVEFEPEEIIEKCEDIKKSDYEPGSDAPCQTPSNEELWIVKRQLCRGCHSEGAFWSLQTMTEGDSYEYLLQVYFNIQLCPVSVDERALSAICALCAARLRDARAFSLQARAAEERFTRFYAQNRVRVLADENVDIKEDAQKVKKEVDDEVTETGERDMDKSKLAFLLLNGLTVSNDKNNKNKKTQGRCYRPASKNSLAKEVVIKEEIPTIINEGNPEVSTKESVPKLNENKAQVTCDKPGPKRFHLQSSDFELVGNSHKCTRCDKHFKMYYQVRNHVMYSHLKLPRYTCPHCAKTFHQIAAFIKHKLAEHSIDDRIKCNACDWFTYQNRSLLKKHINAFHMLGEKLTCPDCEYVSYSQKAMKNHVVKHSTVKEHHCRYCKKSFLRKTNLTEHERIHTGDKRKVCNVCGQAFVQRASLKYHMEKYHPEVRL